QSQSINDFKLPVDGPAAGATSYRLVCAAQTFGSVIGKLKDALRDANGFAQQIHSVFLYSNGDPTAAATVASQLSGAKISVVKGSGNEADWRIAEDPDGIFR